MINNDGALSCSFLSTCLYRTCQFVEIIFIVVYVSRDKKTPLVSFVLSKGEVPCTGPGPFFEK
jgi:hypothetical protein